MITPEKMDEWIREVEERPSSAAIIVRYIASRLGHLAERNEELLAENIQLRTEQKVEEYEARIAALEYQLDLLKRQLGGEAAQAAAVLETLSLFVYNPQGQVLRIELDPAALTAGQVAGQLAALVPVDAEADPTRLIPALLAVGSHEELLFLFDSGRIVAMAAASIPTCTGSLDWAQAFLEEPRGGEELAAIVPIGRMSLSDCVVQASRRGYVKKMMRSAFEGYVSKNFVGTGVSAANDQTCGLVLCAKDERLTLASQAGFLLTTDTARLPYTIEETIRLGTSDHVVSAFAQGQRTQVAFVTNNGKCVTRETSYLEPAASFKTRGQALFSEERRKRGVRLVWAGAVDENDWAAAIDSQGRLTLHPMQALLGAGALFAASEADREVVSFSTFPVPK